MIIVVVRRLNVKSIMRSPHEVEDTSKITAAQLSYFEEISKDKVDKSVSKFKNMFIRCLLFIICKKMKTRAMSNEINEKLQRHVYSFTQFELNNITGRATADANIQTSESLEMQYPKESYVDKINYEEQTLGIVTPLIDISDSKISRELKAVNFLRNTQSQSSLFNLVEHTEQLLPLHKVDPNTKSTSSDEKEETTITSKEQISIQKRVHDPTENPTKKLRFEDFPENNDSNNMASSSRRNKDNSDTAAPEERVDHISMTHSISREQRWFWNRDHNKSKKPKKPSQFYNR